MADESVLVHAQQVNVGSCSMVDFIMWYEQTRRQHSARTWPPQGNCRESMESLTLFHDKCLHSWFKHIRKSVLTIQMIIVQVSKRLSKCNWSFKGTLHKCLPVFTQQDESPLVKSSISINYCMDECNLTSGNATITKALGKLPSPSPPPPPPTQATLGARINGVNYQKFLKMWKSLNTVYPFIC